MVCHAVCSACNKAFADDEKLRAHHAVCSFMRRQSTPQPQSTDTDVTLDPAPVASSTPQPEDAEEPSQAPVKESYICGLCGKPFDNEAALSMHESHNHNIKSVLTPCIKCGRVFQSLASMLQQHAQKHQPPKYILWYLWLWLFLLLWWRVRPPQEMLPPWRLQIQM